MKNQNPISAQFIKEKSLKSALIVKSDFLDYKKGSLILEPSKISEILESSFSHLVNKTNVE